MRTFLISYDLAQPNANKNAINSAIMMLGQSWARPLASTWYIRADIDEGDIECVLGGLIDDDDGLLVQAVESDAMLANTELRWFRQRQQPLAGTETNIVAFPATPEPAEVPHELALAS